MAVRRLIVLSFGLAGFALAGAASADAATFCVQDPACVSGGGTNQATVQAAFDAAVANGFTADTVRIGPTPTPIPGGYSDGQVDLVGAGADQTKLTGTTGKILDLRAGGSTVRDLGIVMAGGASGGLETDGPATRVSVTGSTTSNGSSAIAIGGGTSTGLNVDLTPSFTITSGVMLQVSSPGGPTPVVVEDSKISAGAGALIVGGQTTVILRRVDIHGLFAGLLTVFSRQLTLDSTSIRVDSASLGPAIDTGTQVSNLTARHLTLAGPGSGVGIKASASCSGSGYPIDVDVSNSIIRGFDTDLKTQGSSGCPAPPTSPAATVDIAHSIFDPAKVTTAGAGGVVEGPGNLNVDPLFTDAAGGNFALGAGSPAIDSGDPAVLASDESATDRAGNPRVADGNEDGIVRTDMGALEVQPPVKPPVVTDVGRKLSFSYSTKKKTFKGEVDSAARECTSGEIEMFRAGRKGRSKRIGSAMTNDDGEFTLKKRAKPGKYFATAAESTLSTTRCLEAKSKTLRVKRPKRK